MMRIVLLSCLSLGLVLAGCGEKATESKSDPAGAGKGSASSKGKMGPGGSPPPGSKAAPGSARDLAAKEAAAQRKARVPDNATSIPKTLRGEWWHAKNAAEASCSDEESKVLITSKTISWNQFHHSEHKPQESVNNVKVSEDDGVFTIHSGSLDSKDCGAGGSTLELLGNDLVVSLDCSDNYGDTKRNFKVMKKAPANRGKPAGVPAKLHGTYTFKAATKGGSGDNCTGAQMTIDAVRISVTGGKDSSCNAFEKIIGIQNNDPHYELTRPVEEADPDIPVEMAPANFKVVATDKGLEFSIAFGLHNWDKGLWVPKK